MHLIECTDQDRLLTVADLADFLSVKPSWVYEAVRSKGLPNFKLGNHLRFSRTAVERWVAENER
jgi:excisionase family DNA binding protein